MEYVLPSYRSAAVVYNMYQWALLTAVHTTMHTCVLLCCIQGKYDLAEVIYEQSHGQVRLTVYQLKTTLCDVAYSCVLLLRHSNSAYCVCRYVQYCTGWSSTIIEPILSGIALRTANFNLALRL
jgi:hypothetical protein